MLNKIKQKLNQGWSWAKEKFIKFWKWLLIGSVVVAAGGAIITQPVIPSTIAEGQVITFPYTDDNSNENLLIYTDQKEYHPIWVWEGFDVYMAVKNESGVSQSVSFQSFFSKDFSIEQVSVLNPIATTTIKESIYKNICQEIATTTGATTTSCYQKKTGEKDKIVLGAWSLIPQQAFSKEVYDKAILDNKIPVKQKIGNKIEGNFIDYSLKNQFSYYKLRIKSNEPFSQAELELEAIGQSGAYGLNDPTIYSTDFNSYGDGTLNGTSTWACSGVGCSNYVIQGTTVYEGAKAVQSIGLTGGADYLTATGTSLSNGTTSVYMMRDGGTVGTFSFQIGNAAHGYMMYCTFVGSNSTITCRQGVSDVTMGSYTAGVWYRITVEWHNSPSDQVRYSLDNATATAWDVLVGNTLPVDRISFSIGSGTAGYNAYYDYIAEGAYVAPPTIEEPQMEVQIIE